MLILCLLRKCQPELPRNCCTNQRQTLFSYRRQGRCKGFLDSLDVTLESRMEALTPESSGDEIAAYVDHLTTRINLINAELNGATADQMAKMPAPAYQALLTAELATCDPTPDDFRVKFKIATPFVP